MRCYICDYAPFADSMYHSGTAETNKPRTLSIDTDGHSTICSHCKAQSDLPPGDLPTLEHETGLEFAEETSFEDLSDYDLIEYNEPEQGF